MKTALNERQKRERHRDYRERYLIKLGVGRQRVVTHWRHRCDARGGAVTW